jgi:hypothetical protein
MRGAALVLAIGALLAPGSASAAPWPVDDGPPFGWRQLIDGRALYEALLKDGREGDAATVECTLAPFGRPEQCVVVEETPGSNMGRAVMRAAGHFKAERLDALGRPTAGRKVRYRLVRGPSASRGPSRADDRRTDQAQRPSP